MDADENQANKNNYTNLAPRPWKSFKSEQAEAMVVQKRTRISITNRMSLDNSEASKEKNSEKDGEKGEKEDVADDAGVPRNLVKEVENGQLRLEPKEEKRGLNPFGSDEEEEQATIVDRKVGVRSSKKRRAPQPPVKESSSSNTSAPQESMTAIENPPTEVPSLSNGSTKAFELPAKPSSNSATISNIDDSVKTVESGKVMFLPLPPKVKVHSELEDGQTVEEGGITVVMSSSNRDGESVKKSQSRIETVMDEKETVIKEEAVLLDSDIVCEEKKVEVLVRTTKKVIDMTIRSSTIEDLDEEDVLQELSDEEDKTTSSDQDTKTGDEIDHEKHKELVLNVETLEQNNVVEEDARSTTEERHQSHHHLESEFERANSGRISIKHGWASFMRGTRPQ